MQPVQVVLYGEGLCPACAFFLANNVAPMFDDGLNKDVFRFRYLAYGNARNLSDVRDQGNPSSLAHSLTY